MAKDKKDSVHVDAVITRQLGQHILATTAFPQKRVFAYLAPSIISVDQSDSKYCYSLTAKGCRGASVNISHHREQSCTTCRHHYPSITIIMIATVHYQ